MAKNLILAAALAFIPLAGFSADPDAEYVEHISKLMDGRTGLPVRLKREQGVATKATFKPPVDILIEAKTDSTNLRLGYAADQVIFNWERARHQLRVDGGPANGQHKSGAGIIPTNKYITIRWLVTPTKQSIFVNDQLRFEHEGDYSKVESPVSVFSAHGSEVTVKSIKVKQLPAGAE